MSDTPRTDYEKTLLPLTSGEWLSVHFARELERELNAAKAELAQRTAERDEARRYACRDELYVRVGVYTAKELADRRGWNCFDAKEGQP